MLGADDLRRSIPPSARKWFGLRYGSAKRVAWMAGDIMALFSVMTWVNWKFFLPRGLKRRSKLHHG